MTDFESLGLSPAILKNLAELGYDTPTPIQTKAIPGLLSGRDLMGLAQTGTGKTAAFGLPLVQLLAAEKAKPLPRSTRALILAPTRELANQIGDSLRSYVKRTPMRVTVIVGGASMRNQIRAMEQGVDILVATPGRLIDHVENRSIDISKAKFLVLDEADQMLDLGFIHALKQIARLVGTPRQTMLFSATMPKQIEQLAGSFLTDPMRVEATPPGRTADKIVQYVHFVPQAGKTKLLTSLLSADKANLSLVFARTKHGAEKLMKSLVTAGIEAASIHGNKSQGQRERAIKEFKSGAIRVLVATDVAARGIDIPGVSHVYNFDLPQVAESYVHRIGRTARAGASGEAVSFCSPEEGKLLRAIERLTGIAMERLNEPSRHQGKAVDSIEAKEMGVSEGPARRQRAPGGRPAPAGGHEKRREDGRRPDGRSGEGRRREGAEEARHADGGFRGLPSGSAKPGGKRHRGNGKAAVSFGAPEGVEGRAANRNQAKPAFSHREANSGGPRRNRRPGRRAAG